MRATVSERYGFINLPHAATVAGRISRWMDAQPPSGASTRIIELLEELERLLKPYATDPPETVAIPVADAAAEIARRVVARIERAGYHGDRLGQCVRNLFECLGLAAEGAELALRCGERPDSPLRP